jgi:predicted metalloprotease with PDZ domain
MIRSLRVCIATSIFLSSLVAAAPLPVPLPRSYPGTIQLSVDATDIQRRVWRVREIVPVQGRELTLLYPQWLPGNHAPRGTIDQLAGLIITAAGKTLAWQRDPVEVFAFRVPIPAGVRQIEIEFQVATPQGSDQGRVVTNAEILGLQWNQVILYPAGHYSSAIQIAASLRLPEGWDYASGLPARNRSGAQIEFATTTLEVLVDSPVFAGKYAAHLDLDPGARAPVRLDLFAEFPGKLEAKPEQLAIFRKLVRETYAVFGAPHYEHYDFLVALSESFGGIGLEHHRSTEISESPDYLSDWASNVGGRDTVAHEFVHSWNGKYRRPRDLWTPEYSVPMQDSLLWVYEGMTQYYGWLLAARSGLWPQEFARAGFASFAAVYDRRRAGRSWRNVADTTQQPIVSPRRPQAWTSWQRSEDYYSEGAMIWLDVDSKLRELSNDTRSLDDFARHFFAAPADRGIVSTYRFEDVVTALQAVAPFDWGGFLRARIEDIRPAAPLDGFTRSGWKLVYNEKPSEFLKDNEKDRNTTDFSYSLGFLVNKDANLIDVVWDSPAFRAGLTMQTQVVAVNGRAYTAEVLKNAVSATAKGVPLDLLVKKLDEYRTVRVDYEGGLVYPHLERIEGTRDRFADLLKPRS